MESKGLEGRPSEYPLDQDEAPAVTVENANGTAPYVLICEHASNSLPRRYHTLGLPAQELERHIGWDIGAAAVARILAANLDAPLVLAGYSRLLIDCNRPPDTATSIAEYVDGTTIPGNQALGTAEKRFRVEHFFQPFHAAVERILEVRLAAGHTTALVGMHSFTPVYGGISRPWHAGLVYDKAQRFASSLMQRLQREQNLILGDNQPYQIESETDYMVPVHGDGRGLPALLVEIRQDLLGDNKGVEAWGQRLTHTLGELTCAACLQPVHEPVS